MNIDDFHFSEGPHERSYYADHKVHPVRVYFSRVTDGWCDWYYNFHSNKIEDIKTIYEIQGKKIEEVSEDYLILLLLKYSAA